MQRLAAYALTLIIGASAACKTTTSASPDADVSRETGSCAVAGLGRFSTEIPSVETAFVEPEGMAGAGFHLWIGGSPAYRWTGNGSGAMVRIKPPPLGISWDLASGEFQSIDSPWGPDGVRGVRVRRLGNGETLVKLSEVDDTSRKALGPFETLTIVARWDGRSWASADTLSPYSMPSSPDRSTDLVGHGDRTYWMEFWQQPPAFPVGQFLVHDLSDGSVLRTPAPFPSPLYVDLAGNSAGLWAAVVHRDVSAYAGVFLYRRPWNGEWEKVGRVASGTENSRLHYPKLTLFDDSLAVGWVRLKGTGQAQVEVAVGSARGDWMGSTDTLSTGIAYRGLYVDDELLYLVSRSGERMDVWRHSVGGPEFVDQLRLTLFDPGRVVDLGQGRFAIVGATIGADSASVANSLYLFQATCD